MGRIFKVNASSHAHEGRCEGFSSFCTDVIGYFEAGPSSRANVVWNGGAFLFPLDYPGKYKGDVTVVFPALAKRARELALDTRCSYTFKSSLVKLCKDTGLFVAPAPAKLYSLPFVQYSDGPVVRVGYRFSEREPELRASPAIIKRNSVADEYFTPSVKRKDGSRLRYGASYIETLCESEAGDCGSLYLSREGVIAVHAGTKGEGADRVNVGFSPVLLARRGVSYSLVRDSEMAGSDVRFHSAPVPSRGFNSVTSTREAALYDISAPGSDYLGPRKNAGDNIVSRYTNMVINPWSGSLSRLPDINITPTCLAKFYANRTYTIPASYPADGFAMFGVNSRLGMYSATAPLDDQVRIQLSNGLAYEYPAYAYAPGSILTPQAVSSNGTFSALIGSPVGAWGDDYGSEQTTTTSWTSAYRTLAMAVRVRVVALPTGTFMAPGKIYFAQIRNDRNDVPQSEQDFVVLERLGRATHVSLDAVRESGSKTFYAVPDSADKFNLSSEFYLPPGLFMQEGVDVGVGRRLFPGYAQSPGSSVIVPYNGATDRSASSTATAKDAYTADQTMIILVGVFGAAPGISLEVDYSTVVEYVPSTAAPPGLETTVQLPSSAALDSIFAACAAATEVRPMLLQAPGDLTITNPMPGVSPATAEKARGIRSRLASTAERLVGSTTAIARREGWFDWLGDVDLNIGDWHLGNSRRNKRAKPKRS